MERRTLAFTITAPVAAQSQRRALQGKLSPIGSHGSWDGNQAGRVEGKKTQIGARVLVLVPLVLQSLAA